MNNVLLKLIINSATLLFALVMNGLSGSALFDGKSVADVSAAYPNLFTPAGYAFAIWGVIYLLLIAFVVYQWVAWFRFGNNREIAQTGWWFALTNLANGLWIYAWLNNHIGLSVALMGLLLISLIVLTGRLKLEIWDAPMRIIAFVWWPVTIYLGWIIVATVANVTVYFVSIGWEGALHSQRIWVIVMMGVASIIYLLLIRYRNMREAAMVGVWALVAIAVKQWGDNPVIVVAALANVVLLISVAARHALNRSYTLPHNKIKRGEV